MKKLIGESRPLAHLMALVWVIVAVAGYASDDYIYGGCDYSAAWGYTGNSTNGPAYIRGTPPSSGLYGSGSDGHSNISPLPSGKVVVPSHFDLHPVVGIRQYSYYRCASITDVTIPNGVMYINEYAFSGCSSMTNVVIPTGITYIGTNAFYGCSSLSEVVLPDSVVTIRDSAFSYCTGLRRIVLPCHLTEIPAYAFSGCTNLSEIVIPETVTNIGRYAFKECKNLRIITLPPNMTRIEGGTFEECWWLRQVTLPSNLKEIGNDAFKGCWMLDDFTFPDGLINIGSGAFAGAGLYNGDDPIVIPKTVEYIGAGAFCETFIERIIIQSGVIGSMAFANCYVDSVVLSNGVLAIEDQAFRGCERITEIRIPSSVIYIGYRAFYGQGGDDEDYYWSGYGYYGDSFLECTSLTNVVIGGDIAEVERDVTLFDNWLYLIDYLVPYCWNPWIVGATRIADEAFGCCPNLTNVTVGANVGWIGSKAFSRCSQLRSLTINDHPIEMFEPVDYEPYVVVTNITPSLEIGASAFYNCSALADVTVPNRVTSIQDSAFAYCNRLTNMIFKGNAPTVGNSVFSGVKAGCTAHVRRSSSGWDVAIPGTWNGLNIQYMPTMKEIEVVNEIGKGAVEVDGELPEVEVASGVTLLVKGENLDAAGLAEKIAILPHEASQSVSYFKVDAKNVAGGVALAVMLDAAAIEIDRTVEEILDDGTIAAFASAMEGELVSVPLPNAKSGLYYGIAVAGELSGLDTAAANVSLSKAMADGVSLFVAKPAGTSAFFRVVVSDRAK